MTRYPKKPTGPTPHGAAGVRALQQGGGNWQTKRPALGVTSKQQGNFQRAIVEQDPWVSSGRPERIGLGYIPYQIPNYQANYPARVTGVVNRKGISEQTGLMIETGRGMLIPGLSDWYVAGGFCHSIEYRGELLPSGSARDTLRVHVMESYIPGARGREVAQATHISHSITDIGPEFVPGAYVSGTGWVGGIRHALQTPSNGRIGLYTAFIAGSQQPPAVTVMLPIDREGLNVRTTIPAVSRISPTELIAFVVGLNAQDDSDPFAASFPRGSRIFYSSNNGIGGWVSAFRDASIFTDRADFDPAFPDRWFGPDPGTLASDTYMLEYSGRFACGVTPDQVLFAVVPERHYREDVLPYGTRLRIYSLNGGGTTTLRAADILIPEPTKPSATCFTVSRDGGYHQDRMMLQFVEQFQPSWMPPAVHRLGFVRLDLSGIDFVSLPRPPHHTGRARALDRETIQCPMWWPEQGDFRAGYWIMVSKDFGQTWEHFRLIKAEPIEPPPIMDQFMANQANEYLHTFSDAFLPRRNGIPSPTFPGYEWMGDSRVAAPWENT